VAVLFELRNHLDYVLLLYFVGLDECEEVGFVGEGGLLEVEFGEHGLLQFLLRLLLEEVVAEHLLHEPHVRERVSEEGLGLASLADGLLLVLVSAEDSSERLLLPAVLVQLDHVVRWLVERVRAVVVAVGVLYAFLSVLGQGRPSHREQHVSVQTADVWHLRLRGGQGLCRRTGRGRLL